MMKKIALALVVVVGGFLGYVAMQPSAMSISREVVIKAPAEAIFPLVNSSKRSNDWMPWKAMDPNLQMSYSGPDEGVGSASSWQSEGQMGKGQSVVIASVPNQLVKTEL